MNNVLKMPLLATALVKIKNISSMILDCSEFHFLLLLTSNFDSYLRKRRNAPGLSVLWLSGFGIWETQEKEQLMRQETMQHNARKSKALPGKLQVCQLFARINYFTAQQTFFYLVGTTHYSLPPVWKLLWFTLRNTVRSK